MKYTDDEFTTEIYIHTTLILTLIVVRLDAKQKIKAIDEHTNFTKQFRVAYVNAIRWVSVVYSGNDLS